MPDQLEIRQDDDKFELLCLQYRHATATERKKMLIEQNKLIRELPTELTSNKAASDAYQKLVDAKQFIKYTQILRAMENQEFFEVMGDYSGMFSYLEAATDEVIAPELLARVKKNFEIKGEGGEVLMRYTKPLDEYTEEDWNDFHTAQTAFLAGTNRTWAKITPGVAYTSQTDFKQLYPGPQMMGSLQNGAVDKAYANEQGEFLFVEAVKGKPQLPAGGMRAGETDFNKAAAKLLDEFLEEQNGTLYETAAAIYDKELPELTADRFNDALRTALNDGQVGGTFKKVLGDNLREFEERFNDILDSKDINSIKLRQLVELINEFKPKGEDADKGAIKAFNEFKGLVQVSTFKLHPTMYKEALDFILENSEVVKKRMVTDGRQVGGSQDSIIFILRKDLEEHFRRQGIDEFVPGDDVEGGRYVKKTMLDILDTGVRWMHGAVACVALRSALDAPNADPSQFRRGYDQEKYKAVRHQLAEETAFARVSGKSDDHKTVAEQSLERYIATRSQERIDQGKEHHSKSAAFFTHMSAKNKISAAVKMLNKLRDPENAELLTPAEKKCIKDGRLKEIISAINFEKDTKRPGPEITEFHV